MNQISKLLIISGLALFAWLFASSVPVYDGSLEPVQISALESNPDINKVSNLNYAIYRNDGGASIAFKLPSYPASCEDKYSFNTPSMGSEYSAFCSNGLLTISSYQPVFRDLKSSDLVLVLGPSETIQIILQSSEFPFLFKRYPLGTGDSFVEVIAFCSGAVRGLLNVFGHSGLVFLVAFSMGWLILVAKRDQLSILLLYFINRKQVRELSTCHPQHVALGVACENSFGRNCLPSKFSGISTISLALIVCLTLLIGSDPQANQSIVEYLIVFVGFVLTIGYRAFLQFIPKYKATQLGLTAVSVLLSGLLFNFLPFAWAVIVIGVYLPQIIAVMMKLYFQSRGTKVSL